MESQQPIGLPEGDGSSIELLHLFDKMKAVKAFVFDVDGVFTDNTVLVTEAGELLRVMHVRDGQALKWAVRAGYHASVITGGRSEGVKKRLLDLGVHAYYSGIEDKLSAYQSLQQTAGLRSAEVAYLGDDLPDMPVMRRVALACCPADAAPEVLAMADYVSPFRGGQGFARDVIEKIMRIQGHWPQL